MEQTELVRVGSGRPNFYWMETGSATGQIVAIRDADGLRMVHGPVPRYWFEQLQEAANRVEPRENTTQDGRDDLERLWGAMNPRPLYITSEAATTLQQLGCRIGTIPTLAARRLVGTLDSRFNKRGSKQTAMAAGIVALTGVNNITPYEAAARAAPAATDVELDAAVTAFEERTTTSICETVIRLTKREQPSRLPLRRAVPPEEWTNPHSATID